MTPPDLSQNLNQSQRQELKLSPRQQQALRLLQLSALELQPAIDEALADNPVLDSDPPLDEPLPTLPDEPDEWLERLLAMSEEQRFIPGGKVALSDDDVKHREHLLESTEESLSFPAYLLQQINTQGLPEPLKHACEEIVSALDEEGYLKLPLADLAMSSELPMPLLEDAREVVRQLDPPGVAALDIQDRLLMQLERQDKPDPLIERAIREHLDDIGANHLPLVTRELGISLDKMNDIVKAIRALNPRLEFDSGSEPVQTVREEATVTEEPDGTLKVRILHDTLPPLYINRTYLRMLEDPNLAPDAREYIRNKLKSAADAISGLLQRQSTLKKVVEAIVSCQVDFFRHGETHLKPLTMRTIATMCDLHETTVGRAVSGKFIRCKFGLYPLRYFFKTGIPTHSPLKSSRINLENNNTPDSPSESVATTIIKQRLKDLIDNENPSKPLSDSKLAELLTKEGFTIARRTVAKYRENINILPTHLRRKF